MAKLAGKPEPGKAGIEAFFTTKGNDLYVILPRWPGRSFVVKEVTSAKSVTLLGSTAPVKFKATKEGLSIQLPEFRGLACAAGLDAEGEPINSITTVPPPSE